MNPLQAILEQIVPLVGVRNDGTLLLPVQASTTASSYDFLFNFITYVGVFFFVLITVVTVAFIVRYRRRREDEEVNEAAHHNLPLELAWSIIPGFLLVYMFYRGFVGYMEQTTPPDGAYNIQVIGQKWNWSFRYPNGYEDQHLTVPVDTPIVLTMTSKDVIHSFYVPAFRAKMDVVPGRYSKLWFEATRTSPEDDPFDLFCAEYCGTSHSNMIAEVRVLPQPEFEEWLAEVSNWRENLPPVERGKKLAGLKGCVQCHSVDGSPGVGPTWLGIWGKIEGLDDGSQVEVDETYVRESILYPNRRIVQGFPSGQMQSYLGQITDEEILDIIEYMKTIK
jgi:cytochrome c oxidase subunit 2